MADFVSVCGSFSCPKRMSSWSDEKPFANYSQVFSNKDLTEIQRSIVPAFSIFNDIVVATGLAGQKAKFENYSLFLPAIISATFKKTPRDIAIIATDNRPLIQKLTQKLNDISLTSKTQINTIEWNQEKNIIPMYKNTHTCIFVKPQDLNHLIKAHKQQDANTIQLALDNISEIIQEMNETLTKAINELQPERILIIADEFTTQTQEFCKNNLHNKPCIYFTKENTNPKPKIIPNKPKQTTALPKATALPKVTAPTAPQPKAVAAVTAQPKAAAAPKATAAAAPIVPQPLRVAAAPLTVQQQPDVKSRLSLHPSSINRIKPPQQQPHPPPNRLVIGGQQNNNNFPPYHQHHHGPPPVPPQHHQGPPPQHHQGPVRNGSLNGPNSSSSSFGWRQGDSMMAHHHHHSQQRFYSQNAAARRPPPPEEYHHSSRHYRTKRDNNAPNRR